MFSYHEARYPLPRRCLGYRLQPLTLDHLDLLARFDSPYALGSTKTECDLADLLFAIFVCSRDADSAERSLQSGRAGIRFWWMGIVCRFSDVIAASILFSQYIAESTYWPEGEDDEKGASKPCRAAPTLALRAALVNRCHMSEAEAGKTPYARAAWLLCGIREQTSPDYQLMDEARKAELEARIAFAKELAEKAAKKGKG